MLLATTPAGFATRQSDLRDLVLELEATGLPDRYQLYLSLFSQDVARETGVYVAMSDFGARAFEAVELSFPPFSYLLTLGEGAVEDRLGRISHFLDSGYDAEEELRIELRVNWTLLPADIASPP